MDRSYHLRREPVEALMAAAAPHAVAPTAHGKLAVPHGASASGTPTANADAEEAASRMRPINL